MKTFLLKLAGVLGTLVLGSLSTQAQERTPNEVQRFLELKHPEEAQFVPGEIIVKMKPNMILSLADRERMGIEVERTMTSGGEIIYRIPRTTIRSLSATHVRDQTLALVQEFSVRPDVEYAQPNYILHIADTIPNDPRYLEQWHYFNNGAGTDESPGGISLPKAWDASTGSSNVVVAVIDTGILPNHPDIAGSPNLIAGYDMITDAGRANDGDGRDSDPTDPGDAAAPNECFPGSPAGEMRRHHCGHQRRDPLGCRACRTRCAHQLDPSQGDQYEPRWAESM
jgi:serine protease